MKKFSFFEIDIQFKDQLIAKLNHTKWRGSKTKNRGSKTKKIKLIILKFS